MRWRFPTLDQVLLVAAPLLGGGALLLIPFGPALRVQLGRSDGESLAIDAALSMGFFLQHSGMVRRRWKAALSRWMPARHLGAVYAIASGIALVPVIVLWQPTTARLGVPGAALRAAGLAAVVVAVAGFAWGVSSLRRFDPLGLEPLRAHLRGRPAPASSFAVRGAYRWVRHPLYLSALLLLWAPLDLGLDRLLAAVLWTAWILTGTVLEERDLVAELGEPYRAYQRAVPMLVPWRRPAPPVVAR